MQNPKEILSVVSKTPFVFSIKNFKAIYFFLLLTNICT